MPTKFINCSLSFACYSCFSLSFNLYFLASLGADIIYNPACVPHLVRVLSTLLRGDNGRRRSANTATSDEVSWNGVAGGRVAYIATVIRNVDTFDCFAKAAADAELSVVNITSTAAPLSFLPYMLSYDRLSVQLLEIALLS